jgi:hypothetical protein
MKTITVKNGARTLKAQWSQDLQEDLKSMSGIDISKELVVALHHELGSDLNRPTLMTEEEYNKDNLDHSSFFTIFGVLHPDGMIDVYLDGKPSGQMTQEEWNNKYFVDML